MGGTSVKRSLSSQVTRSLRPKVWPFSAATAKAFGEISTPKPVASGKYDKRLRTMAPLPVPTSMTTGFVPLAAAITVSTSISVSGRGMSTSWLTLKSSPIKAWFPRIWATDKRLPRFFTSSRKAANSSPFMGSS